MKIIYDYIAIIAFFAVFKFYGIYWATAAAIIISGIQLISYRLIYKRFDKMYLITFGVIFVLGGTTLLLHNAIFIKWKPTIIYWVMAIALFISTKYGKKTLLERLLGEKITLPKPIWLSMTEAWGYFFLGLGMLNIYVLYHFSTAAWVNFKLFGTIGLIVVFTIFTSIYMNISCQKAVRKRQMIAHRAKKPLRHKIQTLTKNLHLTTSRISRNATNDR